MMTELTKEENRRALLDAGQGPDCTQRMATVGLERGIRYGRFEE